MVVASRLYIGIERAVRRRGLYHIVCIGIHSGWYQLL